jgi:IS605 OrfB family transposase
MITVRKIKLTIIGTDEERKQGYKFIRDSQYAQYQGLNLAMSILSSAYLESNRDIKSDIFKEAQKSLTNSNPIFDNIGFGTGIDTKSAITQRVKKDFKTSLKNGLAKGERTITNYKRDYPLLTRGRDLKFQYKDNDIIIKWVNKIQFKVVLGSGKIKENKIELQHTLHKIINKEYKVGQSSLQFDRNNNLILNLNLDIPYNPKNETVEGRTLGVDLGIKYPAYMCLNDDTYKREHIGSIDDFLRIREQMQDRRRKLQHDLKFIKGGKGRNKKMQALDRLRDKEKNFVTTYNHMISKNVVEFANKNQCEYINMEKLTKDGFNNKILRNWSYYQLQQYIEYKAEREGIKVRYIDPAYTSQTCARCGHIDKENRQTQEKFICTKCGFELNADHNASINIARSDKYIK